MPLALLMTTVAWADILWTIFLMLGWEHARIALGDTKYTPLDLYDYPWSHSLLMLVVWGALLGGGTGCLRKIRQGRGLSADAW